MVNQKKNEDKLHILCVQLKTQKKVEYPDI